VLIVLDQKPAPALSGTLHSDMLFITTRGDQTTNMKHKEFFLIKNYNMI